MKRISIALFLMLGLIGCAQIGTLKENIFGCWGDDACRAEAMAKADSAGNKAGDFASLSGFPWAEKVAKPAFGYAVLLFTLAALGKKKNEVVVA